MFDRIIESWFRPIFICLTLDIYHSLPWYGVCMHAHNYPLPMTVYLTCIDWIILKIIICILDFNKYCRMIWLFQLIHVWCCWTFLEFREEFSAWEFSGERFLAPGDRHCDEAAISSTVDTCQQRWQGGQVTRWR